MYFCGEKGEMLNMENTIAWEATNKFWEKYGKTVVLSELLKMKKVPSEILGINDEVYLKISESGDLYVVKVGKDKKASVLHAEF